MGKVPTSTLKEKFKKKYEERKNIIDIREKLYEWLFFKKFLSFKINKNNINSHTINPIPLPSVCKLENSVICLAGRKLLIWKKLIENIVRVIDKKIDLSKILDFILQINKLNQDKPIIKK